MMVRISWFVFCGVRSIKWGSVFSMGSPPSLDGSNTNKSYYQTRLFLIRETKKGNSLLGTVINTKRCMYCTLATVALPYKFIKTCHVSIGVPDQGFHCFALVATPNLKIAARRVRF